MRILLCLGLLAFPVASQPPPVEHCPLEVMIKMHSAIQVLELAAGEAMMLSGELNDLIVKGEAISADSDSPAAAAWATEAAKVRTLADEGRRTIFSARNLAKEARAACPSPFPAS